MKKKCLWKKYGFRPVTNEKQFGFHKKKHPYKDGTNTCQTMNKDKK